LCAIEEKVNSGAREQVLRNCRPRIAFTILAMIGPMVGVAGLTAAVSAGYQSMAPEGQWYGRTFTGLERGSKKLALTYDDGPNDPHTLRLLEVLAKHKVRATFFVIGQYVQKRPDIAREIVREGHALGNHTFSHRNLIFVSNRQTKLELEQCQQVVSDATGVVPCLFRPPWGGRRPGTLPIARRLKLQPVMWNVPGCDWKRRPAEYIEQKVRQKIRGGDVILLHDGSHTGFGIDRTQTVIATDRMIVQYRSEGYEFVTIPEMIESSALGGQVPDSQFA
jgi:peptidoglycan/xylan/chitin deacetylase (PgdA/CDA1 family)